MNEKLLKSLFEDLDKIRREGTEWHKQQGGEAARVFHAGFMDCQVRVEDSLNKLTIKHFINVLEPDQLNRAACHIESRMKKIREAKKVKLWLVGNEEENFAAFREGEIDKATEKLSEIVKDPSLTGTSKRFEIRRIAVLPDEVDDYLTL